MTSTQSLRAISASHHASGRWNTSSVAPRNSLLRALINFGSFKRQGVNDLARRCAGVPSGRLTNTMALDAGCGNGSYARWFLSGAPQATVIALDWTWQPLKAMPKTIEGTILRVCADLHHLPFKASVFAACYSVDTLGHLARVPMALNEIARVCRDSASLFMHSECNDYQNRWPDKTLIKRIGADQPAQADSHVGLMAAAELRSLYTARFTVQTFSSPAGLLGWLIGYPHKYAPAFKAARMPFFYAVCLTVAFLRRLPVIGLFIRFVNVITNHFELFVGIENGGSCFAVMKKPAQS